MKQQFTAILILAFCLTATLAFAQPANDDCSNAIALTIYPDEASCVLTNATTVSATGSLDPSTVCSGTWFQDDVWFSFTTGAVVPNDGYTIQLTFGAVFTTAGMGIYKGCGANEIPFQCFSNGDGSVNSLTVKGLDPNTTYYVRVWSGGGATTNSGTFDICVFEASAPTDIIIWGDQSGEGDFDGGLNNWTTTGSPVAGVWKWDATGLSQQLDLAVLFSLSHSVV